MSAFLMALVPAWLKAALACAGALAGLAGFSWLKDKSIAAQATHAKREELDHLAENHAVEQKEAAATTDQEAYAALNADRQSDHR